MARCKDCMHYEDPCDGFIPSDLDSDVFDYCRKGIPEEIPDIDERCSSFKNKADVVEVKHGYWELKPSGHYSHVGSFCSVCGKKSGIGGNRENQLKPYCPNCGAKMDGERSSNERRHNNGRTEA